MYIIRRMNAASRKSSSSQPDFLSRSYWNGTIKMSLSKFFVLSVIYRRPMHGYDIMREVARVTSGCCSPAEGTIYPVLKQFEEGGYLASKEETVGGRVRKIYSLTDKGRQAFRVAVDAWMEVTESLLECKTMLDREEARSSS